MTKTRQALAGKFNGGNGGDSTDSKARDLFENSRKAVLPHSQIIWRSEYKPDYYTDEVRQKAHLLLLQEQMKQASWLKRNYDEIERLFNKDSIQYDAVFSSAFSEFTKAKSLEEWKQDIVVCDSQVSRPKF